jgi:3-phenylpropionate/cinnamic acid dioxygenase small subunit
VTTTSATDATTAIAGLIYGYAEAVDLGDFESVSRLFDQATYRAVAGDTVHVSQGADEVLAQLERLVIRYADGTPGTKHMTTNLVIDVDESADTATSRSYFTVLQAAPGPAVAVIVAGRYHDAFAQGPDGSWRFTDRLIFSDLIGDLSRHLHGKPLG